MLRPYIILWSYMLLWPYMILWSYIILFIIIIFGTVRGGAGLVRGTLRGAERGTMKAPGP